MTVLETRSLKKIRAARTVAGNVLPDNFVRPAYDGYSLANVANTVMKHFGVAHPGAPLADDVVGDGLKGAKKVVVLLVDAMGYCSLSEQMKAERSLPFNQMARKGRLSPITSVFPSTTAVCTSSFYTGLSPVEHGIMGYRMFIKERGVIGNMIGLTHEGDPRPNLLIDGNDGPGRLLGVPTAHKRLRAKGVDAYCLIRNEISSSGLSQMLFQGAEIMPVVTSADLMVQIRKLLQTDPQKPAVIWAYWGQVDRMQHVYGTRSDEMRAEVRSVAFSLQEEVLKHQMGTRASLMVMADHGHVEVGAQDIVSLARMQQGMDMMALPLTGTGRTGYFHARSEKKKSLLRYLQKRLSGRALVCDAREAVGDGLWGDGPVRAEVDHRVGDVLAMPFDTKTLFYPYRETSHPSDLYGGRHGGLHEDEMLVPFFSMPLK